MKGEYYIGCHRGTFRDPIEALVKAGFRKEFAVQQTQSIGDEGKVFVARDGNKQYGTTLVKIGETWARLGLATSNGRGCQS